MDDWVTTKEASLIKKVGLTQHRIAELARQGEVVAQRAGKKKWWVKVTLNNGKYELVKPMALGEIEQVSLPVGQAKEPTDEQQAEGRENLIAQQLIQQWQNILHSFLPIQLLERELNNASQEAFSDFFSNVAEKEANDRAREQHFVELRLNLESDPPYSSFHQRFPQSRLLDTLDASLEAWQKCEATYMSAFFDMMSQVKECAKLLMDTMPQEAVVDGGNLSAHITNYRKQRAYAVLVTSDLLVRGLSELPSDVHWWSLIDDLEKLRVRVNLELSSLTGKTRKGGWPSNAEAIWTAPKDSTGIVRRTRTYLNELVKLQSAKDSLKTALRD